MNKKTTYELTIAEKLEQLTAPDMVDAIWAKIEAQLDLDLPTDDGPANPPPAPTRGPLKWINRGFMIAAVAFVLIYIFNKRKQTTTYNDQPTINTPVTTPNKNDHPGPNNSQGANDAINPLTNTSAPTTPSAVLPVDSNSTATVTGAAQLPPDSSAVDTNVVLLFDPAFGTLQKNTHPDSTKKVRGVKGITDADYKIVPKNDSSKN